VSSLRLGLGLDLGLELGLGLGKLWSCLVCLDVFLEQFQVDELRKVCSTHDRDVSIGTNLLVEYCFEFEGAAL